MASVFCRYETRKSKFVLERGNDKASELSASAGNELAESLTTIWKKI